MSNEQRLIEGINDIKTVLRELIKTQQNVICLCEAILKYHKTGETPKPQQEIERYIT